jgi:hypothetical protein
MDVKALAPIKTPAGIDTMSSGSSPAAVQERAFGAALQEARDKLALAPDAAALAHAKANPATGLGGEVAGRLNSLSDKLKSQQQEISRIVERATATGDMNLMLKASMMMADHQVKLSMTMRSVSKAATSIDQLTRLQ